MVLSTLKSTLTLTYVAHQHANIGQDECAVYYTRILTEPQARAMGLWTWRLFFCGGVF